MIPELCALLVLAVATWCYENLLGDRMTILKLYGLLAIVFGMFVIWSLCERR